VIVSSAAGRAGLRLLILAAPLILVSAASAQEPGAGASPDEPKTRLSEAEDSVEATEVGEATGSAETDEVAPAGAAQDAEQNDLDFPVEVETTDPMTLDPEVFGDEAQEPKPDVTLGIEEILVTSQRRMSTLQDIPVSATIFTASDIEAAGMADIRDISAYTPNLEIKTSFAASNPTLFIRGVGLNDYNANAASAVAVYQDDIYMNSPAGQLFQFFDVEGVEVLRGPQGSLYGRNASAGAIRVISRKPTNEFEANAFVGYGNWNAIEVEAAASVPLIDDVLAARVAGRFHQRDGFVENRCGGLAKPERPDTCGGVDTRRQPDIPSNLPEKVNDIDRWALRGLMRFTPPEFDMDLLLNVHGGQNLSYATQLHHVGTRPKYGKSDNSNYPAPNSFEQIQNSGDPYAGDYNKVGDEKLDVFGTSITANVRLGALELTSVSGYEWNDRFVEDNTDANPNLLIEADFNDSAWQFSEDLRLSSDAAENFSWVVGGYYLMEELRVDNVWDEGTKVTDQSFDQDLWTFAFYGHFTWRFLDDFALEGGVRYNWERKTFTIASQTNFPNLPDFSVPQLSESMAKIWSAPTGDLSLTYHLSEDATVYAKYSRGWKGGHFNGGAVTASSDDEITQDLLEPVDPESVDSWELGLKSFWFDRRLMLNLTGFYYRYRDLQVFNLENQAGALPVQLLINANDAEVYGVELDLHARPVPGLDIRTQGGWLESQYLDFTHTFYRVAGRPPNLFSFPLTADFTGNRLVASPQFTLATAVEYEIPLWGWGSLVPRYDFTYKSETYFDPTEGRGLPRRLGKDPLPELALGQKGYVLHNARIAYRSPDGHIELAFWVRNLLNKQYKVDAFDLSEAYEFLIEVWGEPRTYGGSLSLTW
jgi:iron complex outermembrane receptor protein